MEFDAFISKNSADQALADSVCEFLASAGLVVFESTKDLPYLKDTDYSRKIFEALDNSKNIIIICSSNENGSNSQWVYDEWSWFVNEIRSKRRTGQVMTIRKDIPVGQLDPQLRKYESFDINSYKSRILPYLVQKNHKIKSSNDDHAQYAAISDSHIEKKHAFTNTCLYQENSHYFVDLGLSVKWATCNLGAFKPWKPGRYFAWGDVKGQTWSGSKWSGGGFAGNHANTYELDANDNLKPEWDAAHANLGGKWRMPTQAEFEELINNCNCKWTNNYNNTGVAGRIFTSKKIGFTDKSIFLPAAGYGLNSYLYNAGSYGYYWSSTIRNTNAWYILFYSDNVNTNNYYRYTGQPIRPVLE